MISKGKLYMMGYGTFTLTSFCTSLAYLGSRSYDFLTLMQELTDGVRFTVFLNFIVFCFLFGGLFSTKVLFGNVRLIEVEHIADKLPFYALNLLSILFNDDNLILNVTWTGLTLLLKIHHIIAFDRVDMLQVSAVNMLSLRSCSRLTVIKLFATNLYLFMLVIMFVCDVVLARILAYDIFQGVSSMGSLLFGIQFGVLAIETFTFLGKMLLSAYELAFYRCSGSVDNSSSPELGEDSDDDELDQEIWENRLLYTQGLDIASSAFESTFYSVFLYTIYFHSQLSPPINIIQGFLSSIHHTIKKGNLLYRFLNQSRHLEDQLKEPTNEELESSGHLCIVCREDMQRPEKFLENRGKPLNPRKHPKKMRCGHILHLSCLMEWIEISDSCPLCRTVVFQDAQLASSTTQTAPAQPEPVARPAIPAQTSASTATLTAENAHQNSVVFAAEDSGQLATNAHIAQTIHDPEQGPEQGAGEGAEQGVGRVPSREAPDDDDYWLRIPVSSDTDSSNFFFSLSSTQQGTLTIKHRNTQNYPGCFLED